MPQIHKKKNDLMDRIVNIAANSAFLVPVAVGYFSALTAATPSVLV